MPGVRLFTSLIEKKRVDMNLHEYQAKHLFADWELPIVSNGVASSAQEARAIAEHLGGDLWAIKAQVHAGGRGKAGGVKIAKNLDEVSSFAEALLGIRLVTIQTDARGQPVNKVLVEAGTDIADEFYLSLLVDRASRRLVVMASTEGGVDIESVAEKTPEKIFREVVSPYLEILPWQGRRLAFQLGLDTPQVKDFTDIFVKLVRLFQTLDCSLIEINPLVLETSGRLKCLDAKVNVDDNALFRQGALANLRDTAQEDKQESRAARFGLNYVALDGNIGCMVNGAGLAMGTMDLVKSEGGSPANFLDVGGAANQQTVAEAFKIILADEKVKAVLINIFGGIVSCAVIAKGIVAAVQEVGVRVPVVVRFEGNNADKGRQHLQESKLNIIATTTMEEAAAKVVAAART